MNIKQFLSGHIEQAAQQLPLEASHDVKDLLQATPSDRPDLADYQCNAALGLAKKLGMPPRAIAEKLVAALTAQLNGVAELGIAGPGFINFKLADDFVAAAAEKVAVDGVKTATPRHVVIDFGGPNIAKELHVGHLRPHIIGDSLQRLMKSVGDNVQSDIHMGDWGTPMGMIIAQLKIERPELDFFKDDVAAYPTEAPVDIEELGKLYKRAKQSWDAGDDFKNEARKITQQLQAGEKPGYRALWQHFRDVSLADVSGMYKQLGVHFDLWLGESDVNHILPEMLKDLQSRNIAVESDGAIVVPAAILGDSEDAPPLILQKSDGGYTYGATDLATIKDRIERLHADTVLYVVDNRQKQHFEQVFKTARIAGYAGEHVHLEHAGNGTINGPDGKPYKTRDGNSVRLKDVLSEALAKAKEELPAATNAAEQAELDTLAEKISIAAIKFQELKNNRTSDYIFDVNEFTRFDGKTGPYLQYAVVRCHALLDKAKQSNIETDGKLVISTADERDLVLSLARYAEAIEGAYAKKEPSVLAEYLYVTTQKFATFYSKTQVLAEEDAGKRASRLKIVKMVRDNIVRGLDLLGIECPEKMVRK